MQVEARLLVDAGSGRPEETGAYLKASSGASPNQGTVYVVAGSSGWTTPAPLNHPAMFADPAWGGTRGELQLGSMVIDIDGNRLDARYLGNDGGISDYFTIIKEELPLLRIGLSANELILSWPATGSNFAARATASLDPPIFWNDVTNTPTVSGTDRIIRLSRPATNQFYRLERTQ